MIINTALMMIIVKGVDFTLRCALKNLMVTHGHWNTEWAAVFCSWVLLSFSQILLLLPLHFHLYVVLSLPSILEQLFTALRSFMSCKKVFKS